MWRFAFAAALALVPAEGGAQFILSERDLPYADVEAGDADPRRTLDLYVPTATSFPSVVLVHGGSLTGGDKADAPFPDICANFVEAGVACASVNYRLLGSGGGSWPEPVQDVAAAYAWVRSNIEARGGDATRVFLVGHSSGCHLASLVGTNPRYLAERSLRPDQVPGIVAMGCRLNNRVDPETASPRLIELTARDFGSVAAANDAVPLAHVHAGMSRMLVLIAEAEQVNPPILADAQAFQAAAAAAGVTVPYRVLPETTHTTSLEALARRSDPIFLDVLQYIGAR